MKNIQLKFLLTTMLIILIDNKALGNGYNDSLEGDNFIEIHNEVINAMCEFLPETLTVKPGIFKKSYKKIFTTMVMCSLSIIDTACISIVSNKFELTEKDINHFITINNYPSKLIVPENLHRLIAMPFGNSSKI
jgi:hypothetical protein